MPVLDTNVEALAHCPSALCEGYQQVPVNAIEQIVERTYDEENGKPTGEMYGKYVATSFNYLRWADNAEQPCPHCGKTRELSRDKRPVYENLSGKNPWQLLRQREEARMGGMTLAPKPNALAGLSPAQLGALSPEQLAALAHAPTAPVAVDSVDATAPTRDWEPVEDEAHIFKRTREDGGWSYSVRLSENRHRQRHAIARLVDARTARDELLQREADDARGAAEKNAERRSALEDGVPASWEK